MSDAPDILPIDSTAVLWSASVSEVETRPLLVLMHGYGSHEGDLFGLSPYLPLEPVIASVRAPVAENMGNAWFPRASGEPGDPDPAWADASARGVLAWLDTIPLSRSIGLLGFSQGAAMALQLMRNAPDRFTYAVQLAGFVPGGHVWGDERLAARRPPVFWGRGTHDEVIPQAAIARTAKWLPSHSRLDSRIYDGVAHEIAQDELVDVGAFIQQQLGGAPHPA